MSWRWLGLVSLALVCAGCAGPPPPAASLPPATETGASAAEPWVRNFTLRIVQSDSPAASLGRSANCVVLHSRDGAALRGVEAIADWEPPPNAEMLEGGAFHWGNGTEIASTTGPPTLRLEIARLGFGEGEEAVALYVGAPPGSLVVAQDVQLIVRGDAEGQIETVVTGCAR